MNRPFGTYHESMLQRRKFLDQPGEPENSDNAGMTVLGGTMVLSAILAQSLIIVNFPYQTIA